MYRTLFGPVPSRRLGMSLGIDLIPMKTCTLNCVYCECGRTTNLTVDRLEYVPFDLVCEELTHFLSTHAQPDYLTFSGSGEPLLNSRIGDVLTFAKKEFPQIPVAVLTNGTLLSDFKVRQAILTADVILPSLDAATPGIFRRINRPHPDLQIDAIIKGLVDFRLEYPGEIWLEVFVIPGENDSASELLALKHAILKIAPDRIQLNTLDRPGTEFGIRPASRLELQNIIDFWQIDRVEIIAKIRLHAALRSYRKDIESAILETIARRPCTLNDLVAILSLHPNEMNKYLASLEENGKIVGKRLKRGVFYLAQKT
jgi:wyosine [tRNA(Phe)-imidazoG37] synthetase (radical SAM superfamily)